LERAKPKSASRHFFQHQRTGRRVRPRRARGGNGGGGSADIFRGDRPPAAGWPRRARHATWTNGRAFPPPNRSRRRAGTLWPGFSPGFADSPSWQIRINASQPHRRFASPPGRSSRGMRLRPRRGDSRSRWEGAVGREPQSANSGGSAGGPWRGRDGGPLRALRPSCEKILQRTMDIVCCRPLALATPAHSCGTTRHACAARGP
jgi:hypothetical protein